MAHLHARNMRLAAAAVMLLSVLVGAVNATPTSFSVRNRLPGPMRVQCTSEGERLSPTITRPGMVYHLEMAWEKQASWTCAIMGPDSYTGTFLLWKRNGFSCGSPWLACMWVADDYGLSLTTPEGRLEHVYHWG